MKINKLLLRQVQKLFGSLDAVPETYTGFLNIISDSYDHYEKNIKMLERSINLSSIEMIELNDHLKEEASEVSKAHAALKMLFDNTDDSLYSVDIITGQVLQMSGACTRIYGYTPQEFFENPDLWLDVILQEDKHIIYENDIILRQGKPITNVYRIRHKDGSIRWLESKIIPTMDSNAVLIRIDGFTSDITKRKAAEESLEASERKFRSLIENTSDAITVMDANGNITYASDSITRITGFPVDEVVGYQAVGYIHPDDILAEQTLKELLSEPGKSMVLVQRILKKDGSYIWCEGLLNNLLHDPVVQGVVSNFRDITERRGHEEALTRNNADLKKINMELDKFVYSTSHDLRAPLSSILGIIDLSMEESLQPKIVRHLNMMKKSILKLDHFIGDILDYSRNSRLHTDNEEIDFQELINEITGNLKYMRDARRKMEIAVDISQDIPFLSDKYRLTVILNNLISNAFRYQNTTVQTPSVLIVVKASEKEAVIKVRDNGIGISKEYHEKVFEMFFRISLESNGSGLGLYIVKETVDKLDGRIELESECGKGSTFSIHIPNNLTTRSHYAH